MNVTICQFTDMNLQIVPSISIEADADLRADVAQLESFIAMHLLQLVIRSGGQVPSIISRPEIVWILRAEEGMNAIIC